VLAEGGAASTDEWASALSGKLAEAGVTR
jgi:hypothetical protein